jgi:Spy/CpxP family protein refolding chaperone
MMAWKVAMNSTSKNKWQVRAAACAIFLLGFVAGALALNVYYKRIAAAGPPSRHSRFERVFEQLQLTPEQQAQVHQILGDAREQLRALRRESEPRMEEIRRQTDARIQQTLTPEQWRRFQQMRDEMRSGRWRRSNANGKKE